MSAITVHKHEDERRALDETSTMNLPFFAHDAQTKRISYSSGNSNDGVTVTIEGGPNGMQTIHDADLIQYVIRDLQMKIDEAVAENRDPYLTVSRTVEFKASDYLDTCKPGKSRGGAVYSAIRTTLERIHTTTIKTNIKSGDKRFEGAFSLIDSYGINTVQTSRGEDMRSIVVTINEWLYHAVVTNGRVLEIEPYYYSIRSPLERSLYRVGRSKLHDQAFWIVGLDDLRNRCAVRSALPKFRYNINKIMDNPDSDYHRFDFTIELMKHPMTGLDCARFKRKQREATLGLMQ